MATLPQALGTSIPRMGVRMPPAPPAAPAPPPAPAGGEFDVLAQQAQQKLEPLQQRISGLESQQMQLGAERSQFEAAQKAKQATGEAGIQQAFQQRTEQAPLRGELEQKVQQEKDFFFQPSREDGMAMASLASLIMVIGTSLGRGGKGNAMAALSGLNGMMEGYQKGRDDIFKQEKSQFETNAKALTTQIGNIRKALEDYEKMAVRDRETATLQLRESMAKEGADFLAARAEREGAVRLLPELRKTERQLQQEVSKYEGKAADARTRADAAQAAAEQRRIMQAELLAQRESFAREQQLNRLQAQAEARQDRKTQEQYRSQRMVNALGGVASTLESISELSKGTTTEWFPNLMTKDGMANAVRNKLGRKISSTDADMMNTFFKGLGRNLSAIEASGLATGLVSLANQLESGVFINAGQDDPYRVAAKLADIRRVAVENMEPAIRSKMVTPDQAVVAEDLIKRIKTVVPYDTVDVVKAYRAATGTKQPTLGEAAAKAVTAPQSPPAGPYSDAEKERRYQEWKKKQEGQQ